MTAHAEMPAPRISGKSGVLLVPALEEILCRLIRQTTGIVTLDHQMDNLRATITRACRHFGCRTAEEFVVRLQQQAYPSPEMEFLIGGITVGESYFFRDAPQMNFLQNSWLPSVISRKNRNGEKILRIWSAGCSGGQEIYTLAIMLIELLPDLRDWTLHLLGTDINTHVLSQAVRGRYTSWSLRTTPEPLCKKYFTHRGSDYTIRPDMRLMTKFSYLNLTSDSFPSIMTETIALDLILCRNVFIYFNSQTATTIMEKFAYCLAPDGVLMLGASDMPLSTTPKLTLNRRQQGDENIFYYTRADTQDPPMPPAYAPVFTPPRVVPTSIPAPEPAAPGITATPRSETAYRRPQPEDRRETHEQIIELIHAERWQDVIDAAGSAITRLGEHSDLFQFMAKALANLGELDTAATMCERSLKLNPTDKHTYLLRAIVMMERNDLKDAENSLRKALFLDSELVEAHFHLGLVQLRTSQRTKGLKSLHNALRLAEKGDPARRIHNAQDMTYGRLAEILRNEISIYEAG